MFKIRKKEPKFSSYPCADHLNLALKFLLEDKNLNIKAIEEICYALEKADAYYYDYVFDMIIEKGIRKKNYFNNDCDCNLLNEHT